MWAQWQRWQGEIGMRLEGRKNGVRTDDWLRAEMRAKSLKKRGKDRRNIGNGGETKTD